MAKKAIEDLRDKIIVKAWKDPAFRKRLLAKPKETLKEMGLSVPDNVQVRIQEDDAQHFTFVLPPPPMNMSNLDEAELKRIVAAAAGCGFSYVDLFRK